MVLLVGASKTHAKLDNILCRIIVYVVKGKGKKR